MRKPVIPKENVLYTFRFLEKDKVKYRTYRYYGEVTGKGRYFLYDINDKHPMSITATGFGYKIRKQLVRKENLLDEPKKEKPKEILKQVESEAPSMSMDEFYQKTLNSIDRYSEEDKRSIKKQGIDIDALREEILSYKPENLPLELIRTIVTKLPIKENPLLCGLI